MAETCWSTHIVSDMTLSAGSRVHSDYLDVREPVFEGLQVIVSLSARLSASIDGQRPFDVADAGVYLVLAAGRPEGCDRVAPGTLPRYVKLGIDRQAAQRHGLDLERIAQAGGERLGTDAIIVRRQPLTPPLRAIASQILTCPLDGGLRDLYLAGKGLELTAIATSQALAAASRPAARRWSAGDIERLEQARALATAHAHAPLTLDQLARQVGVNVKKLTSGFRELFGTSVFGHVQEVRLAEAHRMLSTGAYSVSEVACHVGYAIPHFSTLFRKRFGLPPSQLGQG